MTEKKRKETLAYAAVYFTAIGLVLWNAWIIRRHFMPGQWAGDQGMFGPVDPFTGGLAIVFFLVALTLSLTSRRYGRSIILLACFTPCFFTWPVGDPSFRIKAELPSYQVAVDTGKPFGDQFEEVVNGRKLTYWRWISWGIDNAIGVIYDPLDKLAVEPDRKAFEQPAKGVIYQIEKIEPRWYFVQHS